jgi:hypothetical protein
MLLVASSFSFLFVAIKSQGLWYSTPLGCIFVLSVLHHGVHIDYPGKEMIPWLNITLAHAIATGSVVSALLQPLSYPIALYWISFVNVMVNYHFLIVPFRERRHYMDHWHAYVHIMAATGMLSLTRAIQKNEYT